MSRTLAARAAGKVSLAVLLSRVLGVVREMTFARLFGAGIANDAFNAAFRVPNLFRDLFAEGALSAAFVPTFTEYLRNRTRSDAFLLANLVLTTLMILLGVFGVVLLLFSDEAVMVVASGFRSTPGKVEITSVLVQILSPFLMFVAMAAVAMGMLNALDHYFVPALAPAIFNAAVIVSGYTLAPWFQEAGIDPILGMAVGTLAGGLLQFLVQLPWLRAHGFRFRLRWDPRHPGIRRMLGLFGPAVVGISAVQVNLVVNTQMATYLPPGNGPVSWLQYAFRIIYLPIGLFGVAVGVVNLRNVSVWAAQQDWEQLKKTVADSLRLVFLLALPSAVGILTLAQPIVRVLYERDEFTASDTHFTAWALSVYALGLAGYSGLKVFVPTFYALGDTRTPVRISILAVAINIAINVVVVFGWLLPTLPEYAFVGLSLGTACSVTLQTVLLHKALSRRLGSWQEHGLGKDIGKMALAAAAMGAIVLGVRYLVGPLVPLSTAGGTALLGACIAIGAACYFGICAAWGIDEVGMLFSMLRGRRKP